MTMLLPIPTGCTPASDTQGVAEIFVPKPPQIRWTVR